MYYNCDCILFLLFFKNEEKIKAMGLVFAMLGYTILLAGNIMMFIDMIYHVGNGISDIGMILLSLAGIIIGYEVRYRHRFLKEGELMNEGDLTSLRYSTGAIVSGWILLGILIILFIL